MRSGTWGGAVSTDNVRVTVDGVVWPVERVRITSGMRDGRPGSESGSWCVESQIWWASRGDVTADAMNPWSSTSGLPPVGASVVIETGDGALGQWWVQHRGVIDDSSGSLADGTAMSSTVDMIDDLSVLVTIPALLASHPPVSGTSMRQIGLQSTYLVDRMWRMSDIDALGWYATPPKTWDTLGSAPMQGSLWPEVGELLSTGTSGPSWTKTDYGVAPSNFSATYSLAGTVSKSEVILSTGIAGGGSGSGTVQAVDGNGRGVRIGYNAATDNILVGTIGATPASTWTVPREGVTRASVHFKRLSSSSQQFTLRLSDGREETWTGSATDYGSWAATRVVCTSTTTTLGWWMCEGVKPSVNRWQTLNHTPTARIRVNDMPWWSASRDLVSVEPSQLLADLVDAELSAMWLDEDGVMQWSGRGVFEPIVQTVTTALDVDDIQWEVRRRALAKKVVVTRKEPRVDADSRGGVTRNLWKDAGVDVGPGETEVIPVRVPEDEDWVGVDLDPHQVTAWNGPYSRYNVGSLYGGTQYAADDDSAQAWAQFIDCTMTREALRDYTVTFGAWSTMDPSQRIKSAYPGSTNMRSATAGLVLRGRARVVWADREATTTAGTTGQAQYVHDVGWLVQPIGTVGGSGHSLSQMTAALASYVSSTQPTLPAVEVAHDPRRQIGDRIRVEDRHVTGKEYVMLVQQRVFDSDTFTDTISGRSNLPFVIPGLSLHAPAGHTALTPATDWNRSVD